METLLTLLRNQYNHGHAFQIVGRRIVLPFLLLEGLRTTILSQKPLQMLILNKSTPYAHTHACVHTHVHTLHLWRLSVKVLSGKEQHSFLRLPQWLFVFWHCRISSKQVIIILIIITTVTSFQGNWLRITILDGGNYIRSMVVTQEDAIQCH